jgi:hypothetical protein
MACWRLTETLITRTDLRNPVTNSIRQYSARIETESYNVVIGVFLILLLFDFGGFCNRSGFSDRGGSGKCFRICEILLDLRIECVSESKVIFSANKSPS